MKILILLSAVGFFMLTACSGSDDSTSRSNQETEPKKEGALMGYVHSVENAKAVQSLANENAERKQRALDNSN